MKELINRLKAPTPAFFKKLQRLGLSLSALSATLMAIPNISPKATPFLTNLAVVGGVIVAVAQFARDTTSDDEQPKNS